MGSGLSLFDLLMLIAPLLFLAASLLSAMDLTADPCEDFFQFACGTWNKVHPIPEDHSSISTFEVSGRGLGI